MKLGETLIIRCALIPAVFVFFLGEAACVASKEGREADAVGSRDVLGEWEGEGEGVAWEWENGCLSAHGPDVGGDVDPLAITLPFCADVVLSSGNDEDCFAFSAPAETLVQLIYQGRVLPYFYTDPFPQTQNDTWTGGTIESEGGPIVLCARQISDEDAGIHHLEILAPVADDMVPVDHGNGSVAISFDAPGDQDCMSISISDRTHVIVTSDDCLEGDSFDLTYFGVDDSYDFDWFDTVLYDSLCGTAVVTPAVDGELCILDSGAERTLGELTFTISTLPDDHGALNAPSFVSLPYSGTIELEVYGDTDCLLFSAGAGTDIDFSVTGPLQDDITTVLDWSTGSAGGDSNSGTAQGVTGDARLCIFGFGVTGMFDVSLSETG